MNILFVDDERMILDGIRRSLFGTGWNIRCANGGQEALDSLAEEKANVVVSDMRMPGINGAQLLEKVHELYPDTVRIILSGYADQEASLRASLVAHQWLDKPCNKDHLVEILKRIEGVIGDLPSLEVRTAVAKVSTLPTPPQTFAKIRELIESDSATIEDVADIIALDPSLTAKVLQLTNSSFFCRGTPVTDVTQAIVRLGFDLINGIVLLSETYSKMPDITILDPIEEQNHSLMISKLSSQIVQDESKELASLAGLLTSVGKFILIQAFPDVAKEYNEKCKTYNDIDLQKEMFGADYVQLSAYLLFLWGFSNDIVEAILNHQKVQNLLQGDFDVACALYVSSTLLNGDEIAPEFIEHFNLQEKLPEWEGLAKELKE